MVYPQEQEGRQSTRKSELMRTQEFVEVLLWLFNFLEEGKNKKVSYEC